MSKFDTCLTSLNLRDAVPVDAMQAAARQYQEQQGMTPSAALLRAAEEQLQLAQMEQAGIVKAVRGAWEAQGGAPRPAPEAIPAPEPIEQQAAQEPAVAAEPKLAPVEEAPAPTEKTVFLEGDPDYAALEQRAQVNDARVDALTDDAVRTMHEAMGLKGGKHSVEAMREKIKAQHPDDVEDALADFAGPKPAQAAESEREFFVQGHHVGKPKQSASVTVKATSNSGAIERARSENSWFAPTQAREITPAAEATAPASPKKPAKPKAPALQARTDRIGDQHKARDAANAQPEPAPEDYHGFGDAMAPMLRARMEKALAVQMRFDGAFATRKAEIERRVAAGARVEPHDKDGRRLHSASGGYLTEKDITKSAMDYAEHLISQRGDLRASMPDQQPGNSEVLRSAKTGKQWTGTVFHGTAGGEFDTFRPRVARSVWFAPDRQYAKKYADSRQGGNRRVLAARVTLKNPLVIDMKGEQDLPKKGRQGAMKYANTIEDAVGVAQQWGHDGVIFKNRKLTDEGFSSEEVAVFDPAQIEMLGRDEDLRASLTDMRTIEVDGQRRPIRNSLGELVAPDFMGQVQFWKNYTGPVDEQGRPVVEPTEGDARAAENPIASDIDAQVAQAVKDGITADKLLALIESETSRPELRELATALRRQNLKTKIAFGNPQGNYVTGNAEQANGAYRQSDDTAFVGKEFGAAQTALHELVHAASLRALQRGGRAAQQIRALHKHIKDMPSFAGMYGTTDPEEFISEALTSPSFRQQLADTPAPGAGKMSIWQKIVGAVRMLLGLPTTSENVLARVMEITPDLFAENQARGEVADAGGVRAAAQWATEAFRKWFKNSKVVNERGEPLVVYHGTSEDFSEFAVSWGGNFGEGFYFGDADTASQYGEGDGRRVMPVYLSLKNPATQEVIDPLRDRAEMGEIEYDDIRSTLEKQGYDGIMADGMYVAFKPEQIKSATGNSGHFDPASADIRASMTSAIGDGIRAASLEGAWKASKNRLADFRNVGLQFLGRRQLVDLYANLFQRGERESILKRYSDLMQQMDADKNESGAEADSIADRWGKLKDADQLADLMHDSTLAQIDPSKDYVVGDDRVQHGALQRRLRALSPEAQTLYTEARDAYSKHWNKVRSEIRSRIARAMPESPRRAALLEKMDATFYEKVKGVYFPLARFGDYVVTVTGQDGSRLSVNFAETLNEADALRAALLKKFPSADGYQVSKVTKKKEFNAGRDAVSRGFMQELFGVLDQYDSGGQLQDDINQLYLQSMPDLSWAKHGIHRKGTPGFSQDARRAFAQNMFHGARYLAKLRYGDRLTDFLDEMQDHVDAKAPDAQYDSVKAQQVVDEMVKRHESYMNPKGNQLSNTLTSVGFLFYLGLSPASAAVNLTQTPLVTLPMLAAKYGFGKASAALLEAAKQTAGNKNDISKVLQGDELRAFKQAVDAGVIDVSMAHDLAGIASGDDTKAHAKLRPVMKWASFMFHHGEKFNRQASLLAAYRLARGAGKNHAQAYESAVDEVYASHFDYASSNRPRVMQGNVAKVVLLFKSYAQNMVYTLTRNAALAAKGDKVALKTLSGLLLSHAMAAGVLGLPIVGTLLSAATMIGGDDDEPWDAKVALRNYIADLIGQKPAEVLMHGLSRATPFDISGRVGLDKLILPDVQEGLEGARLAESWMTAALGPVAGIGLGAAKGAAKIAEGDYLRGLEDMLPVSVRNPIKALRLNSEGVKDRTGIPILDDTSAIEEIGQLIGFSPSRSREAMEGKSAVYRAERKLTDRRQALVEQWAQARMAGDAEGEAEVRELVSRFNEKNPGRRISPAQVMQSVRNRNKRIREAEDGIYLPKKHADVRDLGRFATAGD